VRAWICAERPDVIVIGGVLYPRLKGDPQFFVLPQKQHYVSLHLVERDEPVSGIYQDSHLLGAIAVEQLIGQLQRGDFGVPEQPVSLLVNGIWQHRRD
jgi:hypothetical protein